MKTLVELLPLILLPSWAVFSIYYFYRAKKRGPKYINKYIFESIPQIFPTIGILCTFIGIAYGLSSFDANKAEETLPALMNGLATAFYGSIGGVVGLIVFAKISAVIQKEYEAEEKSDETIALNRLIEIVYELKENFIFSDDNNNKVKPANIFRDIYEESRKQSLALQTFSTDLAIKIEAGFETILSNQIQDGVIPELQAIKTEIEGLGKKLQDPTKEMTQNVVKDLEAALERMVNEFRTSVSGSAKSELENLAKLLGQAGGSLTDFPVKLQVMTDNLNENFRGLQEVVKQISQQTLSQSEASTDAMKKQVEEMSEILKNKVGNLQAGQEVLMTKQSENLQISDKLLNAFNTSIEKMNKLSDGVNDTISKFSKVQNELDFVAAQLKITSENVNSSSGNFKEAQLKYSEQSAQFLSANSKTIDEIQKALTLAKNTVEDYASEFKIIENGLKGIFNQIQGGLNEYRDTIGESLQGFLGKYTETLTKTAESLAGAIGKHEDSLEELTEQLSKLKALRN